MSARVRRFASFWREHGTGAAVRLVRTKLGDAIAGRPVFEKSSSRSAVAVRDASVTVQELVVQRFASTRPMSTYWIPKASLRRVSLVTDSIGSGSLFGGVGTALLFAAQLANRMNATLRIVTRTEPPSPSNASQILGAYGIQLLHEMQFAFAPWAAPNRAGGAEAGLDIQQDEIFVTTSWWTTAATLPGVPHASIIYLLQEDERMFYPFGEDRFHCEEVLQNRDITFVINTRLLYDHLIHTGLDHLSKNAYCFEPAFPKSLFHERPREQGGKRRFFFYARPNNLRNLFYVGLAVIERAINEGVLDLDLWDVYLVGKDIPNVVFGDGYVPKRCEGLDWNAYADLMGTIDLGLSLMYTPHPSYPPLDLAASGAVVVTNKFANKTDLSQYSSNIICAELELGALVEAVRDGISLAENTELRRRNFLANGLGVDWEKSFEETLVALTASR